MGAMKLEGTEDRRRCNLDVKPVRLPRWKEGLAEAMRTSQCMGRATGACTAKRGKVVARIADLRRVGPEVLA